MKEPTDDTKINLISHPAKYYSTTLLLVMVGTRRLHSKMYHFLKKANNMKFMTTHLFLVEVISFSFMKEVSFTVIHGAYFVIVIFPSSAKAPT